MHVQACRGKAFLLLAHRASILTHGHNVLRHWTDPHMCMHLSAKVNGRNESHARWVLTGRIWCYLDSYLQLPDGLWGDVVYATVETDDFCSSGIAL